MSIQVSMAEGCGVLQVIWKGGDWERAGQEGNARSRFCWSHLPAAVQVLVAERTHAKKVEMGQRGVGRFLDREHFGS